MIMQPLIDLGDIFKRYKTVAVVGLSPKPVRPSNEVARYLVAAGYDVIPVNPGQDEILGKKCYPSLLSVPGEIDIVNVFRNLRDVPGVVDDAIAIGTKVLWLQLGVVHEEAAQRAADAGIIVFMDRCIKVDRQNFLRV